MDVEYLTGRRICFPAKTCIAKRLGATLCQYEDETSHRMRSCCYPFKNNAVVWASHTGFLRQFRCGTIGEATTSASRCGHWSRHRKGVRFDAPHCYKIFTRICKIFTRIIYKILQESGTRKIFRRVSGQKNHKSHADVPLVLGFRDVP